MPCYHPLDAWMRKSGGKPKFYRTTGKREAGPDWARDLKLPCGRCIGCKLERSKQWAVRLMHEAQLHKENSFITLTNNNENTTSLATRWEPTVPYAPPSEQGQWHGISESDAHAETHARGDSLVIRHAQLFMKRLRKERYTRGKFGKVKYYLVGEYGEKTKRPHYHLALFGEAFSDDRYEWRTSPSGFPLYRSSRLEKIWTQGNCEIGDLTFESAAYIARYIMKKITGPEADDHYARWDLETGERYWLQPEFGIMSKGLGKGWWEKYKDDVLTTDTVHSNGLKLKPPRYYDNQLMIANPFEMDIVKLVRELKAETNEADNTPARLKAKETVALAKLNLNKRSLE